MARNQYRLLFKTVTFLFGIALLASCNLSGEHGKRDEHQCETFLGDASSGYMKVPIGPLNYRMDSFFAALPDLPPRCHFLRYIVISHYYEKTGKTDSSIAYADSALGVMRDNKLETAYPSLYVSITNYKGQMLYQQGRFNASYNDYFNARLMAETINDTCMLSDCAYHMGMITYKQEKYREALEQFEMANEFAVDCHEKPTYSMQQNLDNIALCYERLELPDSALYYYDSAMVFVQKYGSQFPNRGYVVVSTAVINGNIGSVLLEQGHADSALPYLKQSYDTDIVYWRDNHDALLVHLKMARAWLETNKKDSAFAALARIRTELDTIKHSYADKGKWLQLMYQYYDQAGKHDSGFKYYQAYVLTRDSVWAAEKRQLQADIGSELNRKEQTYQMNVLQKQNKMNGRYLLAAMSFMGMALLILILVYVNYRREKKNIRELTKLKDRLEAKDKEKDKILNIVAHDLRGPVSGIYMVADMMMTDENKTAEQQESIDMIKSASESAIALINQLMAYRKEAREELVKEPADIVKLADETIKILQLNANEKGIMLRKHLATNPVVLTIDKEKIKRVLTNLVGNAIKFSSAGSGIDISVSRREDKVLMTVKDTGIGIPDKYKDKVFDMFTESKREGTAGETSFGLGLSITRQIVEQHGGRIWLESQEGKGTTFYVELPLSA